MTYIVSSDPAWWPAISASRFISYFSVVSFSVVVYDWALTFSQELELIWRQRWSFMTVLYISTRYIGIFYSFTYMLWTLLVPITDLHDDCDSCNIIYFIVTWVPVVINAMLGVIMMTRIHAMYGRSKKMFIFLTVLLLVSTITTGVMAVIGNLGHSGGEGLFSGYRICVYTLDVDAMDLNSDMIIPTAIWEIIAFFFAVWIVIKYLRELRQSRSTIGDCFTALIQSHMLYFLAFAVVACLILGTLSPNLMYSTTSGTAVYNGILDIAQVFQMFVLGPRLILGVRQYNAKLMASQARSDEGTYTTSIAFHAGRDALTGDV